MCDDTFDINEANVVCRELGYEGALRYHGGAYFGVGEGEIWLENLNCKGDELSLHFCEHSGIGMHNCIHREDVGVVCKGIA